MSSLNIRPITKNLTLTDNAAERLREAIISGDIPPRTKLIESRLSTLLGISRGPLREAIRLLANQGLIETIPYKGSYVHDITVKSMRELYTFRTEIERFAFQLVWHKRSPEFQRDLHQQQQKLTQAINREDAVGTIFEELELHSVVYNHCDHEILKDTWQRLRGRLHLYFTLHQKAHNRSGPKVTAHDSYVALACGSHLEEMLREVSAHMQLGYTKVEEHVAFIEKQLK